MNYLGVILNLMFIVFLPYILIRIYIRQRITAMSVQLLNKKLDLILVSLNPEEASAFEVFALIDGVLTKVEGMNLKKEKKYELVVSAKTKGGKPTKLDGDVVYTVPEGLEIVEADGKKFLKAKDDADESVPVVLMADADGDLGEGVKPLHFEAAINIIPADAETLEIGFGEAQDV